MPSRARVEVSLLFTDIEGSTRLWQEDEAAMRLAVERHDALLAESIHGNGGHIVKHLGDGVFAVFEQPDEAVRAAADIQRALADHDWPTSLPIRVRAAVHTGPADLRDGDYFGPEVNRCARLQEIGHGGQTLVTAGTADLLGPRGDVQIALRDLGVHALRDLAAPQRVFQLDAPGLESTFPPLRSIGSFPNNLPFQLTSFVGRGPEIARVAALVASGPLTTLLGCGGCGKTRLALQVAAAVLESYPDGAWFVELASVLPGTPVVDVMLDTVGVRPAGAQSPTEALHAYIADKRCLFVVDNCEHLVDDAAHALAGVLRAAREVRVLATSRESLGLPEETVYPVPALKTPSDGDESPCESVELFLDRARAARPDVEFSESEQSLIGSICTHLDGIPLAIELAAARVSTLSVAQIAERISDRFRLLARRARGVAERQATLRGAIDWSYELLSPVEKDAFALLSVFPGDFGLEAAEAILAPAFAEADVLDALEGLLHKSVLVADYVEEGSRYRMLETLREYASERLAPEDARGARERHRAFFTRWAEARCSSPVPDTRALAAVHSEHHNLRAALDWALAADQADEALRLCARIWTFWQVRGHLALGRAYIERALSLPPPPGGAQFRGDALRGAAALAYGQGDYEAARRDWSEAADLLLSIGDSRGFAACVGNLGNLEFMQCDYQAAAAHYEESLQIHRELGDRRLVATHYYNLGQIAFHTGDGAAAKDYFVSSLEIMREIDHTQGCVRALCSLGHIRRAEGDLSGAADLFAQSRAIAEETGDTLGLARALSNMANLATDKGEYADALACGERALALRRQLGERRGAAATLVILGSTRTTMGEPAAARPYLSEALDLYLELAYAVGVIDALEPTARWLALIGDAYRGAVLVGAALALRDHTATSHSGGPPDNEVGRCAEQLRETLGPSVFAAACREGAAMTLEQAAEFAKEALASPLPEAV